MSLREDAFNDTMEALHDRISDNLIGIELGANVWFTPTEKFYGALESYKHLTFVDCGTGMGFVPRDMRERGFKAYGVDLVSREGQDRDVVQLDSRMIPFSPKLACLICRPCHNGFALATARRALQMGSPVFYVGLSRNYQYDIGQLACYGKGKVTGVGKEHERLYTFMRDDSPVNNTRRET
jgi:hypothetical protein